MKHLHAHVTVEDIQASPHVYSEILAADSAALASAVCRSKAVG